MTEKKKELNKSDSKADLKNVPRLSQVCIQLFIMNNPVLYLVAIVTEFNSHNSTNISTWSTFVLEVEWGRCSYTPPFFPK